MEKASHTKATQQQQKVCGLHVGHIERKSMCTSKKKEIAFHLHFIHI